MGKPGADLHKILALPEPHRTWALDELGDSAHVMVDVEPTEAGLKLTAGDDKAVRFKCSGHEYVIGKQGATISLAAARFALEWTAPGGRTVSILKVKGLVSVPPAPGVMVPPEVDEDVKSDLDGGKSYDAKDVKALWDGGKQYNLIQKLEDADTPGWHYVDAGGQVFLGVNVPEAQAALAERQDVLQALDRQVGE